MTDTSTPQDAKNLPDDVVGEIMHAIETSGKIAVTRTMAEFCTKHSEQEVLRVILFAMLEFALKLNVMATKGVDECRTMAEMIIDHLASDDEDVLEVFKRRKQDAN